MPVGGSDVTEARVNTGDGRLIKTEKPRRIYAPLRRVFHMAEDSQLRCHLWLLVLMPVGLLHMLLHAMVCEVPVLDELGPHEGGRAAPYRWFCAAPDEKTVDNTSRLSTLQRHTQRRAAVGALKTDVDAADAALAERMAGVHERMDGMQATLSRLEALGHGRESRNANGSAAPRSGPGHMGAPATLDTREAEQHVGLEVFHTIPRALSQGSDKSGLDAKKSAKMGIAESGWRRGERRRGAQAWRTRAVAALPFQPAAPNPPTH